MSQSYKGMTIPSYTDAADAPKGFQDYTDSGPIPRFADATARDAAITTPVEGQLVYLTTPNEFRYYDGATWVIPWTPETSLVERVEFGEVGDLTVKTGTNRWYAPFDLTIQRATASVATAPTGATAIFDVNKNGTTIFTTQGNRPTIAASGFFDASGSPDVTSMTKDVDYLTVDIDQIGSTVAGADPTIVVEFVRV